jgi:hypothetical protein
MIANIITKEDLDEFKADLLKEFRKILSEKQPGSKQWLKSSDVRRMLGISHGTLQHLRNNGTLPYTKIGGVIFYDQHDIQLVLEEHKNNRDFPSPRQNPWNKI